MTIKNAFCTTLNFVQYIFKVCIIFNRKFYVSILTFRACVSAALLNVAYAGMI